MKSVIINRIANKIMMIVIMTATITIVMTWVSMTLSTPPKILAEILMTFPSFRCHQHFTGNTIHLVLPPAAIKVSIVILAYISPFW